MSEISASPGASRGGPFRRSEHALSHVVYGLILAVATLGELIRHEVDALEAAVGLYLVAVVLLAAHLFSDVFARLVAEEGVNAREVVRIGQSDVAVMLGGLIMGSTMMLAHVLDSNPSSAMTACLVGSLGWLAAQTFLALRRRRPTTRLLMSGGAVAMTVLIVALENLH